MTDSIQLYGVKTNNLKNIDVEILKNNITSITGVSGGGKSSLAYDTIYALCEQEFSAISQGYFEDAHYILDRYAGIGPAVAIRQINRNLNTRSTIYSYYNFFSILSALSRNSDSNFEYDHLRLNKPGNECEVCNGRGTVHTIDEQKIVDSESTLEQNPFFPWRSKSSDKYEKLLKEYCAFKNLDMGRPFSKLTAKAKKDLLYASDSGEFLVKYKHNGRYRQRQMRFTGPITELQNALTSHRISERNLAEKYSSEIECASCRGSRVSVRRYNSLKICGIPMLEFFSADINTILNKLGEFSSKDAAFNKLRKSLQCISKMGLGYLSLSRSVPSLSGGELQKLNFSRLLMSEMSGIVVVIDEMSSQVHVSDYAMLFDEIEKIKRLGNTVVLVEHSSYFAGRSDYVMEIGPGSGRYGGWLVNRKAYPKNDMQARHQKSFSKITLPSVWKNNVKGLTLDVVAGGINVICGKSGAGKSSIAEFFADNLGNVVYVSQTFIRGHVRSSVASYLELNELFTGYYAACFSSNNEIFSASAGKLGACQNCNGSGVLRQTRDYDTTVEVICDACNGRLFAASVEEYKIDGLNIADMYALPLEQILKECKGLPIKITRNLEILCSLRLGHLSLNRKTSSLSGGELRRLKLLKHLSKRRTGKILIVDEPGAGLDDATCEALMEYLNDFAKNYLAIILIDHKPSIFLNSDHVIEIGRDITSSHSEVIYCGNPARYYCDRYVPYLRR
ncbi:ATP-binding cassette domain-containing protein [Oxalobacteraceae sp. CFBP 13730]|nr:ATP-binding cassette domain-containing protein [Oxalobacteraceae sp. CFBP 13730]